jgi:hypothetical protein
MFLEFSCYKNFKIYQMDVKSTFLNGNLEEEVYTEQPKEFRLLEDGDYLFKLNKYIYVLKQDPRAWYSILDQQLKQKGFKRGVENKKIYIKREEKNMIIIGVYVDDIFFRRNIDKLRKMFIEEMQREFENAHSRRAIIILRTTDLLIKQRYLHISNEVH